MMLWANDIAVALEALLHTRKQWGMNELLPPACFHTRIRGGAGARSNRGVALDCIIAKAATAEVTSWRNHYSLPSNASYAYAKYGAWVVYYHAVVSGRVDRVG